eukprot:513450-Rhodomonas_salina.1
MNDVHDTISGAPAHSFPQVRGAMLERRRASQPAAAPVCGGCSRLVCTCFPAGPNSWERSVINKSSGPLPYILPLCFFSAVASPPPRPPPHWQAISTSPPPPPFFPSSSL